MAHMQWNGNSLNSILQSSIQSTDLLVQGSMPNWLTGKLYFSGPSFAYLDTLKNKSLNSIHLFDGFTQIHTVSLRPEAISHTAAFIQNDAYKNYIETGKSQFNGFGRTYHRSWQKKIFALLMPELEMAEIPNTAFGLTLANGSLLSLGHRGFIVHNKESLAIDTTFANTQTQLYRIPHLETETKTGISWYITVEQEDTALICIHRISASGEDQVVSRIPMGLFHYMHSFCVTKQYIILTLPPLIATTISAHTPFIKNFSWTPELGTSFLVINKQTGTLEKRYTTSSFFALHNANAYEQDGKIILDVIAYQDASVLQGYYLENLNTQAQQSGILTRYTLAEHNSVWSEVMSQQSVDFVSFNEQLTAQPYRYAYTAEFNPHHQTRSYNYLSKIDTKQYTTKRWYSYACYPAEPLFIPAPHALTEDDGIVISMVYHAEEKKSFVLILDAQNFTELARVQLADAVPYPARPLYLA